MHDQKLILLVEDHPEDVFLLKRLLGEFEEPLVISQAFSLSEAKKAVAKQRFDAIILDLGLPDSFGEQTFTELFGLVGSTPIIILTGSLQPLVSAKLLREGAFDFLCKNNLSKEDVQWALASAFILKKRPTKEPVSVSEFIDDLRRLNVSLKGIVRRYPHMWKFNGEPVKLESVKAKYAGS